MRAGWTEPTDHAPLAQSAKMSYRQNQQPGSRYGVRGCQSLG